MSRQSVFFLFAAMVCSVGLLGQSTLPAAHLTFKNIDVPGAQVTFSAGINNRGEIVGDFEDAAGVFHGYLANPDGSLRSVIDFPGATQTDCFGDNERGEIVGAYVDAGGATHGFLLKGGNFTSIDFPNAVFTSAEDINDQGDIAGLYLNSGFDIHGFILDKNGFTTIDDPSAASTPPNTQIFSINNRKEVVGVFLDAAGIFHGFRQAHGVFTTIDAPDATQGTVAQGLSDPGAIVGDFIGADGFQHGFLLKHNRFQLVDFPNGSQNAASQINASGSIVGIYADSTGAFHSFLAVRAPGDSDDDDSTTAVTAPLADALAVTSPAGSSGTAIPALPCSGHFRPTAPRGVLVCQQP